MILQQCMQVYIPFFGPGVLAKKFLFLFLIYSDAKRTSA